MLYKNLKRTQPENVYVALCSVFHTKIKGQNVVWVPHYAMMFWMIFLVLFPDWFVLLD